MSRYPQRWPYAGLIRAGTFIIGGLYVVGGLITGTPWAIVAGAAAIIVVAVVVEE